MPASAVPVAKAGGPSTAGRRGRAQRGGRLAQGPGRRDPDGLDRAGRRQGRARRPGRRPRPHLPRRQGRGPARPAERPAGRRARPGRLPRRGGRCAGGSLGRLRRPQAARAPRCSRRTPSGPRTSPAWLPRGAATRSACSGSPTARPASRSTSPARGSTSGGPRSPSMATARSSSSGPRTATATGTSTAGPTTPTTKPWSEPKRLTTGPGTDTDVVLATAPDGKVWMAWQSWHERPGRHPPGPGRGRRHADPRQRSARQRVVAGARHRQGGADPRRLRQLRGGQLRRHAPHPRPRRHARPGGRGGAGRRSSRRGRAWPIDPTGRVWVAYEERTENWGKDAENLVEGEGSTLYRQSAVRVRCVDGDRVLDAPDPVAEARRARHGHEQLPAARRRPLGPDLAGLPASPGSRSGATRP